MKDNLLTLTRQTIKKYNMLSPGDHVVVGVSGGADSMVLLHVLLQLQEEWDLTLTAAHVNHGLRGEESDRDQAFVEDICHKWGVPCRAVKEDILAFSKTAGRGVEETARGFRYAFFQATAEHPTQGKIATAHTADDNAETVLLNMVRGTGVTGLGGIPPAGRVVRPLIGCSRQMVEDYCRRHLIPYVTDSTNLQDEYRRNRIRHHIIPALKEENPSFLKAISRMTEANRRDSEFLLDLGKELLNQSRREKGYDVTVLRQAHPVPLSYAIKAWLQLSGSSESAYRVEKIGTLIQNGYGCCSLGGKGQAQVSGGLLRATVNREEVPDYARKIPIANGEYSVGRGKKITLSLPEKQNVHSLLTYNGLDRDTIGKQLFLRNRRAGDKITLPGRCTKSLKKLFIEQKIPVWERSQRVILCDERGILWVEGVGPDKRCVLTEDTKQIMTIDITEEQ